MWKVISKQGQTYHALSKKPRTEYTWLYNVFLCRMRLQVKFKGVPKLSQKEDAHSKTRQWMCMAGACKEKPRSFLNQHQKHQQDHANVNCSVINHLVQSEIWRGTWKPFIKQWRWMCLETQIIPIQTTISMSRMKSSTMLPFWWTLCFDSHSTCQHSWTICTKLVQW